MADPKKQRPTDTHGKGESSEHMEDGLTMDNKGIEQHLHAVLSMALKYDTIPQELVRARKALGWTQSQLHEQTGISREAIAMYERGRNKPGVRELLRLCDALKISPHKLLLGTDEYLASSSPIRSGINLSEEREIKVQMRLVMLFSMLTNEERQAILTLVESIIIGRDGVEKFNNLLPGLDGFTDHLIKFVDQVIGEWHDFKLKAGLLEELEAKVGKDSAESPPKKSARSKAPRE